MFTLLTILQRFLIPPAEAVMLDTVGNSNPAVANMWAMICAILPFCGVGLAAPGIFVAKIILFVFRLIAGVAVIMLIWAGIKLIIAQGSDEAITEARKISLYALAGIALAMLGNALIVYIVCTVLPQLFAGTTPANCIGVFGLGF